MGADLRLTAARGRPRAFPRARSVRATIVVFPLSIGGSCCRPCGLPPPPARSARAMAAVFPLSIGGSRCRPCGLRPVYPGPIPPFNRWGQGGLTPPARSVRAMVAVFPLSIGGSRCRPRRLRPPVAIPGDGGCIPPFDRGQRCRPCGLPPPRRDPSGRWRLYSPFQ